MQFESPERHCKSTTPDFFSAPVSIYHPRSAARNLLNESLNCFVCHLSYSLKLKVKIVWILISFSRREEWVIKENRIDIFAAIKLMRRFLLDVIVTRVRHLYFDRVL